MGHLLATVNPQAADRAHELRPLPAVGTWVQFYPRMGEVRRGRRKVPALVTHADEDNRLLDLVVIHDASDVVDQQRIPERTGEDRGWVRMEDASKADEIGMLRDRIADLRSEFDEIRRAIFGAYDQPEAAVLELIDNLDGRLGRLEAPQHRPTVAVKRPPGRPRKVI